MRDGILQVVHIPSVDNLLDILTKSISRTVFEHLRSHLGLYGPDADPTGSEGAM